jgi:TonB family protein
MALITRAPRRKTQDAPRAFVALLLSILGHVVFVGVVLFFSLVQVNLPGRPVRKLPPRAVTLRGVTADQWAKNRGQQIPPSQQKDALAQRTAPPKKEEKKPDPVPKGQVVDVAPGNGEESPDAKYLAESSNRTDKERRSRDQTAFYRNAMPRKTSNAPQQNRGRDEVDKPQIAGNQGLGQDDRPLRTNKGKSLFEVPNIKRQQEVALKQKDGPGPGASVANRTESAEVRGNSNRLLIQKGEQGSGGEDSSAGKKGAPGITNLIPSISALDKISGAAPNDHLADMEEGDGTYLNTKEWKYASFFNRVKQGVGMHWDPGSPLRLRDPTGNMFGGRDRFTLLKVTLDEHGSIKNINVEKSSGLEFLDLEAVAAFERAQPFPNPPPGLVASDSTVRFSFGFFLDMGGGPKLRLFRQTN